MDDSSGNIDVFERDGGAAVLVVAGELDAATAPRLREKLIAQFSEEGHACLVVDLTAVTFVDATALGVLVAAQKRAASVEGWLRLVVPEGPEGRIRQLLALVGLHQTMPVYETVDAALQGRPPR